MTDVATVHELAITDLDHFKSKPVSSSYAANLRTFYSPIDDVHDALKAVIASAQHSIVVAMYGFDDDELAAMLDTALKDPTKFVQISLDKSQAGGVHERVILEKYSHEMTGNSVAIGTSERGAIMHRKMVIVDGLWRISGSTNWSTSGESMQDNEATILRDAVACAEARTVLDIEHDKMLSAMKGKP
jgi:phosphatidylserine/phosphatidylglycerophosphate/cardiolipin synthase-like enzyme